MYRDPGESRAGLRKILPFRLRKERARRSRVAALLLPDGSGSYPIADSKFVLTKIISKCLSLCSVRTLTWSS